MNITVINGSPKGDYSVTLQTVKYLEKLFGEHQFSVLNAARKIRVYEKDFTDAAAALMRADLVLFSYPVYTFAAPSQLHRFIELMKASGCDFTGKYMSQITTSKHFYDITAHRFIQDNCRDMGFLCLEGLSADMEDLLNIKGQKEAKSFFEHLLFSLENGIYNSLPHHYTPNKNMPVTKCDAIPKTQKGDVVIVTDYSTQKEKLTQMIQCFDAQLPIKTRIIDLSEFAFSGGCLGCLNCAATGKCVYKDGFDTFLRTCVQNADAIVYAFAIKDHSQGSIFKTFDDRQFCNGHRTVTAGKPVGYLVCGNISEEENLRLIINGRSQTGGNYLAGIACDETDPDSTIKMLAENLAWALKNDYTQTADFLGVGGMKIFRDLIYGMRGMMKEDHKFYKKHGLYNDFPQKKKATTALMYLAGAALSNDKVRSKMGNKMNEGMLMPYRKIIENIK